MTFRPLSRTQTKWAVSAAKPFFVGSIPTAAFFRIEDPGAADTGNIASCQKRPTQDPHFGTFSTMTILGL